MVISILFLGSIILSMFKSHPFNISTVANNKMTVKSRFKLIPLIVPSNHLSTILDGQYIFYMPIKTLALPNKNGAQYKD